MYTWNLGVSRERAIYVVVGFQTDKGDDQVKNPAIFDHCSISRIKVLLNSVEYPAINYLIGQKKVSRKGPKFWPLTKIFADQN